MITVATVTATATSTPMTMAAISPAERTIVFSARFSVVNSAQSTRSIKKTSYCNSGVCISQSVYP